MQSVSRWTCIAVWQARPEMQWQLEPSLDRFLTVCRVAAPQSRVTSAWAAKVGAGARQVPAGTYREVPQILSSYSTLTFVQSCTRRGIVDDSSFAQHLKASPAASFVWPFLCLFLEHVHPSYEYFDCLLVMASSSSASISTHL